MCTIVRNGCWDGSDVVELLVVLVIDCDTTTPVGVVWPSVSIVVGLNIQVVLEH